MARKWPESVTVIDFGIRRLDLAYAMLDDPEVVLLVDAVARGGAAGALYVIEPELDPPAEISDDEDLIEAHSMDPVKVLRLAMRMGARPGRVFLVGCEPGALPADVELMVEMSAPVRAAVDDAVGLVAGLVEEWLKSEKLPAPGSFPQTGKD
jgi:hydrogenase maturation protease